MVDGNNQIFFVIFLKDHQLDSAVAPVALHMATITRSSDNQQCNNSIVKTAKTTFAVTSYTPSSKIQLQTSDKDGT